MCTMMTRRVKCRLLAKWTKMLTWYFSNTRLLTNGHRDDGKFGNKQNELAERIDDVASLWSEKLENADVSEPRRSINLIIAHVLGEKMIHEIQATYVTKDQRARIDRMCRQRMLRMPVQYVIGEWDFLDLTLKMRPPVFIPRVETEELAEYICTDLETIIGRRGTGKFLEFGSGSGALSIHILNQFRHMHGVTIDKSVDACDLSAENAKIHSVQSRLSVVHMDYSLTESKERLQRLGPFDLLIANPPYIPSSAVKKLDPDVSNYEDIGALDGGEDGLVFVRIIMSLSQFILLPGGHSDVSENGVFSHTPTFGFYRKLWLEVDLGHTDKIRTIVESNPNLRLHFIDSLKDYTQRERFCVLKTIENL